MYDGYGWIFSINMSDLRLPKAIQQLWHNNVSYIDKETHIDNKRVRQTMKTMRQTIYKLIRIN
jgi:hypothetical protein